MGDDNDNATVLKAALTGSNEVLKYLLYRGPQALHCVTGSIKLTITA